MKKIIAAIHFPLPIEETIGYFNEISDIVEMIVGTKSPIMEILNDIILYYSS